MTQITAGEMFVEPGWPRDAHKSDKGTVLLVEDEAFVREGARETLRSAGYGVLVARSADEARRLHKQWGEAVDLLLTDVVLPAENGMELARSLRSGDPKLKVLLMSGYAEHVASSQGHFEEFLEKPFSMDALLRRVGEVLNNSRFSEPGREPVRLACVAV
jgi:two-component system cell cycle sensor histidine kinase/response regulator CckA